MTEETSSWAERTVELPPRESGFRPGVARVTPITPVVPEPSTTPTSPDPDNWPTRVKLPLRHRLARLRPGSGVTVTAMLFAFVCWGVWAIAAPGDLTGQSLIFLLSLGVAVGLFALCRTLGGLVLERLMGRTRRNALGSHIATGVFLIGVGFAYLRQTEWVMSLWSWATGNG
ncbi:MAG TPA: hypothetical protein VF174_01370 [Micromonosporaceae bacterium]